MVVMTTIRSLISTWMLMLIGSLLLPQISFAVTSSTTYEAPVLITTESVTSSEYTTAIATTGSASGWQGEAGHPAPALLGLSRLLPAPKSSSTALSPFRNTRAGETFQHYSSARHADSLSGGLRPGGYATTTRGLTGSQAQSGLALPQVKMNPRANQPALTVPTSENI